MAPLYLPVSDGRTASVAGLIGLLSQRCSTTPPAPATERDPDPRTPAADREARSALIEAIIEESEDESLMDRYLGGEDIDVKVLIDDLETAVARGSFYPVLAAPRRSGSAWPSCSRC